MTDKEPLGPPPVDPMSDVAWARVERKLWARIESGATDAPPVASRRRWLWIAIPTIAAAAAVALLLGTGVLGPNASESVIVTTDSTDSIEPSRVVAGDAPSSISFGDAHIALASHSALVMSRELGSPSVLLERGVATFAVAPRADRPPFVVRAGDTVIRVIGTRFQVARTEERITVSVEHGIVDVQFRGTTRRVGANQSWISEHPETVALAQTARTDTHDPTSGTAASGSTESGTTTSGTTTSGTTTSGTTTSGTTTSGSGTRVPPTVSKDLEREKYNQLTSLEQRNPEAALAGYLDLSRGNTKWSAVALYAAGRLAADRKDRRAQTLLTIYLRRFPDGANADDARNLLARLKGDAP
jgi:hypothetical protein